MVSESGVAITLGGVKYYGEIQSWRQFNKSTEKIQESGGWMEYLGADQDPNGKMFCGFQENHIEDGKIFAGKMHFVENDVVFEFQKTRKPVTVLN